MRYAAVAAAAHRVMAYLYRLVREHKTHASPNTIIRTALALGLSVTQTDELLMAGGFAPLVIPGTSSSNNATGNETIVTDAICAS